MIAIEERNVSKRVTMKHCFIEEGNQEITKKKEKQHDGFSLHSRTEKEIILKARYI